MTTTRPAEPTPTPMPTGSVDIAGPEAHILGRTFSLDSPAVRALAGSTSLGLPLLAFTAIVALLLGPAEQQVTQNFLIALVAVVGFGIYSGNTGILTFGHVAFMGVAAYAAGILTIPAAIKAIALPNLMPFLRETELPLFAAAIIALVVVSVVALLFGFPLSRLSAPATPIATLAMLIIVYVVLVGSSDVTRGSQTFYGVPPDVTLLIALGAALGAIFVARLFRESRMGLRVRASREDELAARSMGIDVRNLRLVAWMLSAVVVGVAGILLGHTLTAFSPKQFYLTFQFALVAMLVVGGPTTVTGAVGGSFLVSLLLEIARRLEGVFTGLSIGGVTIRGVFGLQEVTLGLLIILVMYRRRDGLFGRLELDEFLTARWIRRRGSAREDDGGSPQGRGRRPTGHPSIRSQTHSSEARVEHRHGTDRTLPRPGRPSGRRDRRRQRDRARNGDPLRWRGMPCRHPRLRRQPVRGRQGRAPRARGPGPGRRGGSGVRGRRVHRGRPRARRRGRADRECRDQHPPRVPRHHPGGLAAGDGGQPRWRVPLRPGGRTTHDASAAAGRS